MNAHDAYIPSGYSGALATEVSLPCEVFYRVNSEGLAEISHLIGAGGAIALTWLPLRERLYLQAEIELEIEKRR